MRFPVPERNEVTKCIDPSVWPDIYGVLYEDSALSCSGGLKPLKNPLRSRLHGHGEFPTLSRDSHLVFLTLDILMS